MALSRSRNTNRRDPEFRDFVVPAGVTVYQGGLAVLDAAGAIAPGSTAVGLTAVGIFTEDAGPGMGVRVRRGCFSLSNSAADPVDATSIGKDVFIVDDETVAKTNGTNTRSRAGTCFAVDERGVWVIVG
ncbi:Uncharacterised protein [Starkeya nomas]|uniref:Bacteriophage protein n=1 Tax=Starkeya nomas TaxID=2666134 RepID=A0A5S9R4D4_9HYPH|nr:hypothetical protein [Starkeya nomas]CAA0129458.1 Uncharacterised protein [Starkeya nomas]